MSDIIVLFTNSLNMGGAERMMVNLANQMARKGLHVYFIVCKSGNGALAPELDSNIKVIDLRNTGNSLFALPGFIHQLRAIRPKAVLSAMPNINLISIWAVRLSGVKTRLVVSERSHPSSQIANSKQISTRLRPWLYRTFYPWADGIVAISKGVADDLAATAHISREKIRVIYNPVFTPEIRLKAKAAVDHPWFSNPSIPVVLTVGRLHPVKDHLTLLLAFKHMLNYQLARLMILGEGPLRPFLEKKITELELTNSVAMPGIVTNPYAYMAKSAVFVLSSISEGFSNVLVEAMACGTPVVATDCPSGPAEILDKGYYGSLVPVGNFEAMAAAILNELENPTPSRKLKNRAQIFSAEKSLLDYIDILGLSL